MWQYHDEKMKELKYLYNRISKQTQNKLQEIFDSIDFDFNNLYSIADYKNKERINTYIEEWKDKGLLTGYFGMLAYYIYKRNRVKNSEILELLIYSAYIEEQNKLNKHELQIFKSDMDYYYQQGQKEVNKTLSKKKTVSVISDAVFLAMLDMPNAKGYIYNEYIQSILKFNSEQLYRQVIIDIQQKKAPKISSDTYQNIIKKQQNQRLNINENKISGDVDLTLIGLNNRAKLEGIYSFDKLAKVKFIAVQDNVTTKMCNSLDKQIFNVHDWNEFERYSQTHGIKTKYKCYGLVLGLNLPPIDDGFHWCRSTIVYNTDLKNIELIAEYNDIKSLSNKILLEIPDNIDDFANLWYNKVGYSDELKLQKKVYLDYKEQQEVGKEGLKASFKKYYKIYLEVQGIDKIITKDNIEIGKIQPHTIYRLACRDLTVNDIKEILTNSAGVLDEKHNSYIYTLDNKTFVGIANDKHHNVKTIFKNRKGGKK